MSYQKSEHLFEESSKHMPGGVNSPVRAFRAVGGAPVFIKKAKGSHLYDVDGNEYLDYVNSWGPAILGHANDKVVEAVQNACVDGLSFGAPTGKELELAELITKNLPSVEMLRLVSSGTEAVMSAIRVARGYTRRDYIIKFTGCYHGHSDGLLVKAGSGAITGSAPDSAGIPEGYTKTTLLANYNDKESVKSLFEAFPEQIAAVVVEPVAANMGCVPPKDGFLEFLREITKENGTVLIFDEVITGFRMGLGGAQGYYNVIPDMTTLGKIIGGGMPMGMYGGRKEIMQQVAPMGEVYQAGTLSGNPIATAAGITTLKLLMEKKDKYAKLEQYAIQITDALKEAFPQARVNRAGSLYSIFFTKEEVVDFESACTSDNEMFAKYFHYLLDHGIYVAPSQYEIQFLSMEHTDEEVARTCQIIRQAGKDLA
ncbi:MAG: glutamate-1-semialdehyde-2,1-aminomutase [Lachnospiraceae bacterium]|nr:glutamate-1-semialdehyde-2,1-aminomutase [Lachnospiraceae bacterium]